MKLTANCLLLGAALLAAPAADAAPGLTAARARIGDHAAFVRVVVDFRAGDLGPQDPTAVDPAVADGRGRVEIVHPGVRAEVRPVAALGVAVAVAQQAGRVVVRWSSAAGRFKYLAYDVLPAPERLVVDLWKSRVPAPAATILDDGCLHVTSFHGGRNVGIAGRALVPLFEGTVVVRLRGAGGRVLVERPLIAGGGRWATSFPYRVVRPRPATLEAVVESAKDSALSCLVQVPVVLRGG